MLKEKGLTMTSYLQDSESYIVGSYCPLGGLDFRVTWKIRSSN